MAYQPALQEVAFGARIGNGLNPGIVLGLFAGHPGRIYRHHKFSKLGEEPQ